MHGGELAGRAHDADGALGLGLDDARDRLIFALDVEDEARARALAAALRPSVGTFKIGLELLMRGGMELARRLTDGSALFIDAKLHDVPATVSRAVAQIVDAGVPERFITVLTSTTTRGRSTRASHCDSSTKRW